MWTVRRRSFERTSSLRFALPMVNPLNEVRLAVLHPAQVPSWRASSHDLLTGATVSDVTDTIPGDLFDELFKPDR